MALETTITKSTKVLEDSLTTKERNEYIEIR